VKKTLWKSAFIEMLWFLRGENNTNYLKQYNVPIWDDWVGKNGAPPGELGPIYGVQWRKWPGKVYTSLTRDDLPAGVKVIGSTNQDTFASGGEFAYQEQVDQVKNLIEMIKTNPTGRRHIVTAWNPAYIKEMGLPPCHRDFQCYVSFMGHRSRRAVQHRSIRPVDSPPCESDGFEATSLEDQLRRRPSLSESRRTYP
jgi:thymidylate synthase